MLNIYSNSVNNVSLQVTINTNPTLNLILNPLTNPKYGGYIKDKCKKL